MNNCDRVVEFRAMRDDGDGLHCCLIRYYDTEADLNMATDWAIGAGLSFTSALATAQRG